MKKDIRREFTICSNAAIGRDTYLMRLCGDTEGLERPGQFVNVCLPDKYLRRPISVCDYTDGELLLMYKVVGEGTAEMERMKERKCSYFFLWAMASTPRRADRSRCF